MSDNTIQLQNNDAVKTSTHPSDSTWFAHWMIPAYDSANLVCNNLQEVMREISSCAKRSRQEGEARTYTTVQDSSLGSINIDREETLDFQAFPMFSLSKKRKGISQSHDLTTSGHVRALSQFHFKSGDLKSILAGEASSESEKELKRSQLLLAQPAIASTLKKTGERVMKTILPGKNNKFHHLLTSMSKENHIKIQSTSPSLGLGDVSFHVDLNRTKSIACTYDSCEQLLSSQWIGHFKKNSSKFSKFSNGMTDEFIRKLMNNTCLSPGGHHQYILMEFNQTSKTFEKKVNFSGSERQTQETVFSDPWISRWRISRDPFPLEKPKAKTVCDPQCSKLPLDQTQLEQFSRIASMAMMGKTMTRKYSSSLKRGSTRVWNMEGF